MQPFINTGFPMDLSKSAIFTDRVFLRSLLLLLYMLLNGCGGGGSKSNSLVDMSTSSLSGTATSASTSASSTIVSPSSTSSHSNSSAAQIALNGLVSYDFVPHSSAGLDYARTESRPGRGLVVELLDENNAVLATTSTDGNGAYSINAPHNKLVKVRVKAQLLKNQSPSWNFKVTDNTSDNSLYSMVGNLIVANESTTIRNLHASSGWDGSAYTATRVAAPFAIIDTIYIGIERLQSTGNARNFPPLELRWSIKNKPVGENWEIGEIGTSFFYGDAIYILGDANNDTDEYDRHVILHEWGHYIESSFSRSDNIGGDHSFDERLDMRVAMSEGFANAFSAMMLEDPVYRDSSGERQGDNYTNDVSRKNHQHKGWYSEASVQSVMYNFYASGSNKIARNFSDIFQVIGSSNYVNSDALVSIYVFSEQLRNVLPAQASLLDDLLLEQNIEVTNRFGMGESNSGSDVRSLPVYKPIMGSPVTVCSANRFGVYNKLMNSQFLLIDINTAGVYQFQVNESGSDSGKSDPDLYLYQNGKLIELADGPAVDEDNISATLSTGIYVLEVVDARTRDLEETSEIDACFNVQMQFMN